MIAVPKWRAQLQLQDSNADQVVTAANLRLSGWGRFPTADVWVYRPESWGELEAVVAGRPSRQVISRGLGRSYGDAALNDGHAVISHLRLNRFLSFDEQTGILECEAGVTIAEILQHFLPRGFMVPVTPGTKFVTIGGAIANDVHGKNHHRDGSIANFLTKVRVLTSQAGVVECSPQQHPDLFWATVAGIGLTGCILSATLQLVPVSSAYLSVDYSKPADLDSMLTGLEEADRNCQYTVAWLDSLARGRGMGRGILMSANLVPASALPRSIQDPLGIPTRHMRRLPAAVPASFLTPMTVGTLNALYYALTRAGQGRIVDCERFFYPLDAVQDWNRLYGRRGFVQFQCALPDHGGPRGLAEILERAGRSGVPSFLAVLKRFGRASGGYLSFPLQGYTLAMDFPVASNPFPILREFTSLVLRYGGRVYLAKDAMLRPDEFCEMYPLLPRFLEAKRRWDPKERFSSSMSRRLRLTRYATLDQGAGMLP